MKKHIIGIIILAAILIALPMHMRVAQSDYVLAGETPYYHMRMSMGLLDGVLVDEGTIETREYDIHPYHVVLALAYKLIGDLAFQLIPAIFAFLTIIVLFLLLKEFKLNEKIQVGILLVYALSPALAATGFIGEPYSFNVFLVLFGLLMLMKKWWPIGILSFLIASLSGLMTIIPALLTLIISIKLFKKYKKRFVTTIVLVGLVLLIGGYPKTMPVEKGILPFVSDLGGLYGFSVFALLLAMIGIAQLWKYKKEYYGVYALILLFFACSFFLPHLLVFSNIIIVILAGIALSVLAKRKWELDFLRNAALLVLFCGLLFSSISHAVLLSELPPEPEFFEAADFPSGLVLTHKDYGFWLQKAGHKTLTDKIGGSEQINLDVEELFQSNSLEKTKTLGEQYGITHVMITKEMKHGLVWERGNQGLAFLTRNNETFKSIKTGNSIQVWEFK